MVITPQEQVGYVKLKLAITEAKDETERVEVSIFQTVKLPHEVFNCKNVRTLCYS